MEPELIDGAVKEREGPQIPNGDPGQISGLGAARKIDILQPTQVRAFRAGVSDFKGHTGAQIALDGQIPASQVPRGRVDLDAGAGGGASRDTELRRERVAQRYQ